MMENFDYDLVEVRVNESKDFKVVDIIYDEIEEYDAIYLRNTFIIDFNKEKVFLNSNVNYIEDESLFKIDSESELLKQFVGIVKVIFNNMVENIAFDNEISMFEVNILGIDSLIDNKNIVLREIIDKDIDDEDSKAFKDYEELMMEIEYAFIASIRSEEMQIENANN